MGSVIAMMGIIRMIIVRIKRKIRILIPCLLRSQWLNEY